MGGQLLSYNWGVYKSVCIWVWLKIFLAFLGAASMHVFIVEK